MNVAQRLAELLEVQAQADALEHRRKDLRRELEAEALARFEADGCAPSWRAPGLGIASLAGVESTEVVVADERAYRTWAAAAHPESAELVVRFPLASLNEAILAELDTLIDASAGATSAVEIEPGLLVGLGSAGVNVDGKLFTEDGQVEGVKVVPKKPYLSVRLSAEAKARARAALRGVEVTNLGDEEPSFELGGALIHEPADEAAEVAP